MPNDAPTTLGMPNSHEDIDAPQHFKDAVETFIDFYKVVMALAIGNCFRSLAQRQMAGNVGRYDILMFPVVLVFIARFFFGDMAYWKAYKHRRNGKILKSDAVILLVNAFTLTYMSFFVGDNAVVVVVIIAVLTADVLWALVGLIFGKSAATEKAFSEVRLGVMISACTLIVFLALGILEKFPHTWHEMQQLPDNGKLSILLVLFFNTLADLSINQRRYLGRTQKEWVIKLDTLLDTLLQLRNLIQLKSPDKHDN